MRKQIFTKQMHSRILNYYVQMLCEKYDKDDSVETANLSRYASTSHRERQYE